MRTTFFSLDSLGDQTFKGHTSGQTWNGWACPSFDFETAMQLVESWRDQGWAAHYDAAVDAFIFSVGHDFETGEADGEEAFGAIDRSGHRLYPVGACTWTWEEVTAVPTGTA